MLNLYHSWRSTCSRKVRICLEEKGLDYSLHTLDLRRFEHHRPEYLSLNPNGVVPTLVHDGAVLVESTLICEYLDDMFPDPPLRPAEPRSLHRMRTWCKLADDVALPAVVVPTWSQALAPSVANKDSEDLAQILDRIPLPERRGRWAKIATAGYSQAEFSEAYDKMRLVSDRMDAALADSAWLMGASFTLADVSLAPYVFRFSEIDPVLLDAKVRPRLAAWLERLLTRPSAAKVLTHMP